MPRIVPQKSFAPPFMRRRQMVQATQPLATFPEPEPEPVVPEPEPVVLEPEPVASEPERARDEEGQFLPDDPSTPDVNEAYVEGGPPWNESMTKEQLLDVAASLSEASTIERRARKRLKKLSMTDLKKDIITALEEATK